MTTTTTTERTEAADRLRELLPPGATVYTVLTHVSRSGMQRRITVLIPSRLPAGSRPDGAGIDRISHLVARVLGRRLTDRQEVVVHGAGMDMGFELVYSLARALHGDGYALTQRWL